MQTITLKARTGRAFPLVTGAALAVVNTTGHQVVDTWAVGETTGQLLSMAHTRMALGRLFVGASDVLYGSDREPMLSFVADTSPGTHDTLVPACDEARYRQLGYESHHDNCADNFRSALAALGLEAPELVPAPLNLFMNVPVSGAGTFQIEAPRSRPGDMTVLRAMAPATLVLSACPQDLVPTNGSMQKPQDVELRLYGVGEASEAEIE